MKIDLRHCRESFFREAADSVSQIEAGLAAIAEGDSSPQVLNAVWRASQSLEGMAGTFGLIETAEFAHAMSRCLVEADRNRVSLLLEAVAVLAALLDSARLGTASPGNCRAVRVGLNAARRPAPPDPASPTELRRHDAEVFLQGVQPAMVVEALNQLAMH